MATTSRGPTPHDCLRSAIERWEGTWQADPNDSGNYAHAGDGSKRLVGTMRGVTPDAYAKHLGVDPGTITAVQMQAEITLDVAADLGLALFFAGPRFDRLAWCPLVEIALDIGWGSGPARGITMLQQLVGATPDGGIGPQTAAALDRHLAAASIGDSVIRLTDARVAFYLSISEPGSRNAGFRKGWLRRANWYRPTNAEWWNLWAGWSPPVTKGA